MAENQSYKKKQLMILLFLLLIFGHTEAKKLKIRSCTLTTGEVVLMDKPCPMNSETGEYQKPQKDEPALKNRTPNRPAIKTPLIRSQGPSKSSLSNNQYTGSHDPQLTIKLAQLISSVKAPNDWFVQTFKVPGGDVITASPKEIHSPKSLRTGMSIYRYPNTSLYFKKDAFTTAIDQFLAIRTDENHQLTESEFIQHDRFKVFNVHYKKQRLRQLTLRIVAQFYVDEDNNDLYVLKFQGPVNHWVRLLPIKKRIFNYISI